MKSLFTFLLLLLSVGVFSQCSGLASIFVSMPTDEQEFENIFQRKPKKGELKEIMDIRNQGICEPCTEYGKSKDDFLKYVDLHKASSAKYLLIIGHNEDGHIRFSDGTDVAIAQLEKLSTEKQIRLVYLSCNAKSYLPDGSTSIAAGRKLSYGDAFRVSAKVDSYKCNEMLLPEANLDARMADIVKDVGLAGDISLIVKAVGGITATSGLVMIERSMTKEATEMEQPTEEEQPVEEREGQR